MLNGKAVPQGELYLARKAGFGNLADIVDRLNVYFRPVSKNVEGKSMPLSLHRTQVSRNINTAGDLIFKEKRKIIQESLHCSPFLDESTTVGMGTRPVYAGAMATTKDFLWACFFVGQSDTAGCNGGQTYFNTVKEIYVNCGHSCWPVRAARLATCVHKDVLCNALDRHQCHRQIYSSWLGGSVRVEKHIDPRWLWPHAIQSPHTRRG